MTDIPVPRGLADASLAERRRIEAGQHNELRAALVRRHFDVLDGEQALAGGLLAADLEMAEVLAKPRPRPAPSVPPVPVPMIEPAALSVEPDLRAQLGLT